MQQTYTKQAIAEHLLDRALLLFLDEKDYLSALNLAGAAEETLGSLVKAAGHKNALASLVDAVRAIGQHLHGTDTAQRDVADRANYAKNSIKHMRRPDESTVSFDAAEEAYDMLERGIGNYFLLNRNYTLPMERVAKEWPSKS